ncbi:MAG: hypothetical protein VXZ84_06985 [Planctomycetota bacterium]|nr:hypothetical protein [Planctomycetota bacterium]
MAETLQDTIRAVRRRAWIAKILYGGGWIFSIITLWLLLIASVDFMLRQNDRLSRMTLSLVFALAVVTWIGRLVLPLIRKPLTDLSLAQRIQHRFPALRHKIATAVEFLEAEKTATVDSGPMRRVVIQEASEALQKLPVREVVHYRHATIAMITGLLSIATLSIVAFLLPVGAGIAFERLVNPFSDTVWPRVNELEFQNTPSHIPIGGLFEAELTDLKKKLPENVNIEYRFAVDGNVKTVIEPMQQVNGIMVAQRHDVQHPFEFRAVGGDDETEWHSLQTVVPPTIESVEFVVHPPSYTGWPAQRQQEQIWGLTGSRVTLTGTASKPITEATLTTATGESLQLVVDGTHFALPEGETPEQWVLKQTGTALLRVMDRHEVESGNQERIAIRVIPESPPTVQIEKPTDYYRASPDATLPLEIFAKDNLALRDVSLHFRPVSEQEESYQSILLWQQQPESIPPDPGTIAQQVAEGDQQLVNYPWNLATYGWSAGTEIAFYASAHDEQPVEGRSMPEHTLQIVDKETLAREIALRQQGLLAELARIVTREKESNQQTRQLNIAWQQSGMLTQAEVQSLRGIGFTEREIRRAISDTQDGLLAKTAALAADLRHNHIDEPAISEQLEQLQETLRRVDNQQLSPLQGALTAARKHAQNEAEDAAGSDSATSRSPEGAVALRQAENYQDQAIASLQPLVNAMLRSNRYRRLAQNLAAIANQQENIRETTEGLTNSLSGRPIEQLGQRERIALRQTAEQQDTLHRELQELLARMQQTAKELEGEEGDAGARLASAVAVGRKQGLGQQMRAAQNHLEANQTGQAMAQQARATKTLERMIAALEGITDTDFAEWIKKLRRAESELARLAEAQEKLQNEQTATLSRATIPDKDQKNTLRAIEKKRQSLEQKLQSLAGQIKNLQAMEAAKNVEAAAEKTQQAGEAAGQGDAASSAQQDNAAADHIAEAREQLARARQEAEAAQLNSLLARLPEQITELLESQKDLLQKTSQAAETQASVSKLTRVEKAQIVKLSRQQLSLIAQAQPIREGLAQVEILQYVLVGCLDKMQLAAERLGQFYVGTQTQSLQQDVIRQLEMVLSSLQRGNDERDNDAKGGGGGEGQGSGAEEQSSERSLAEIRLLKLLQLDLNRRSESIQGKLQKAIDEGQDLQPFIEQLQQLGPEQAKLALWTLGLLRDREQTEGGPQNQKRMEL